MNRKRKSSHARDRNLFTCLRCDWTWFPHKPNDVRICPKCKSARWNEPKPSKGGGRK